MTSRDFAFWLQGSFEVSEAKELSVKQVDIIKAHLALVFKHEIDPSMGDEDHQFKLNEIHDAPHLSPKFNTDPDGEKMRC